MPKHYGQACPVAKALELVGDRWTLLLVRDLLRGTKRFQELAASQKGIAPNILSDRLKLMEEHGLATREFYSDHPPRARYTLTERGRELGFVVGALAAWGSRHVYQRAQLVHADCGHEVKLGYHCAHCETRVPGGTVTLARVGTAKSDGPAKRPSASPRRARGKRRRPPGESR